MNGLFFPQPSSSSPSKTGTLQTRSVTASQLATDSPAKMNGHYHDSGSMYRMFNTANKFYNMGSLSCIFAVQAQMHEKFAYALILISCSSKK
jgi:hypothetical protein